MRVTMLTTSFPLSPGHSSGVFIRDLATGLLAVGHEVRIVAPHAPPAARREVMEGLDVRRFVYALPTSLETLAYGAGIPTNLRRRKSRLLLLPAFVLAYLAAAAAACRDCDLVHAHWTFSGMIGLLLQGLVPRPLVVTVHGSDINALPVAGAARSVAGAARPVGGPAIGLTLAVLRRADEIICVSEDLARSVRRLGADPDRVTVVHNGLDLSLFDAAPRPGGRLRRLGDGLRRLGDGHRLLWVGRLSREKGLPSLLEALPRVLEGFPDAHLTLVGEGEDEPGLRALAHGLGLDEAVTFAGPCAHDEVPGFLADADLFVFPSLQEGLGIAALEAMAAGLPVVASSAGGIPEVVEDGETGLLVPPGDPAALAEAIRRILGDPPLAARLGAAGRRRAHERFSRERQIRLTLEVYERALRARGPAPTGARTESPQETRRDRGTQ